MITKEYPLELKKTFKKGILVGILFLITIITLQMVSAGFYYYCYQESANTSNQSGIDGQRSGSTSIDCMLNYTGTYNFVNLTSITNLANMYDGNWGNSGYTSTVSGNEYFYINYTKPLGGILVFSQHYQGGGVITNGTIYTNGCFGNPVQIRLYRKVNAPQVNYWQCYNYSSSAWANYSAGDGTNSGQYIYEESMYWMVYRSNNPSSPTVLNPNGNLTVNNTVLNITWTNSIPDDDWEPVSINRYNVSLLNNDNTFNKTINSSVTGTLNYTAWTINITSGGWYKIRVDAYDNYTGTNYTISNPFYIYNAKLNISAKNLSSGTVNTFTLQVYDPLLRIYTNHSTTTGYKEINTTYGNNYSFVVFATNYSNGYATATQNTSYYQYLNITLGLYNSISVTIKDEITNALVTGNATQNTTLVLVGNTTTSSTSSTGYYNFTSLIAGNYVLTLSNSKYQSRTYSLTVSEGSNQTLLAYLLNTTYSSNYVVFTVVNDNTNGVIQDVSIIMSRLQNGTWLPVDSQLTDITGRTQFNFQPLTKYYFVLSKSGYTSQAFYLNPVIFTSYTIKMSPIYGYTPGLEGDDITIIYGGTTFYTDVQNDFTFSITSANATLTSYNYSLTYPGGSSSGSGINALGQVFTTSFNISNATAEFSTVNLSYCYKSSLGEDTHCYNYNYEIVGIKPSGSWIDYENDTFGIGLLERLLIVTITVIIIVGLFTIFVSPIAGGVLGLFIFGLFVALKFIPLWAILPSVFVGFIILSRRNTG